MRRPHPLEILALALIAIPNAVFTLGCIAPGCGEPQDAPPAPLEVIVRGEPPALGSTADLGPETGLFEDTGALSDTAAPPEPERCDGTPGLALVDAEAGDGRPPPDEVWFAYGADAVDCAGDDTTLEVGVAGAGLLAGPVEVRWSLAVGGGVPLTGSVGWTLACDAVRGMTWGGLAIELPLSADGQEVALEVEVTDAAGTEVSAAHTFLAHVFEGQD